MADSNRMYITGETYSVRNRLKQFGCRWDSRRRAWYAETAEIAARAQAIVPSPAALADDLKAHYAQEA